MRLVRGNSLTISSFAQAAIVSASSGGNPSRCTVTRLGSGTVKAGTRSALPGTATSASSAAAVSRMNGSAAWTTFGVRAVTMTRRTAVCCGGSSSPRIRSSSGISTPGAFMPDAFENAWASRSASRHSA